MRKDYRFHNYTDWGGNGVRGIEKGWPVWGTVESHFYPSTFGGGEGRNNIIIFTSETLVTGNHAKEPRVMLRLDSLHTYDLEAKGFWSPAASMMRTGLQTNHRASG